MIETTFSLLRTVYHAKKMFHRTTTYQESRLAHTSAMFQVLIGRDHYLHSDHAFKPSTTEFFL